MVIASPAAQSAAAILRLNEPVRIVEDGRVVDLPPLDLADLGDPGFCRDHGLIRPYVTGSMANGIASVEIVQAMGSAGMLGFFGAAGLPAHQVEKAIDRIPKDAPHGFNLIHSPNEPALEEKVVDLYLRHGVRTVETSAYLDLTPHVVRYRVKGLRTDPEGRVVPANRILAKVSRVEVATKFLSPPPDAILDALLAAGKISEEEKRLARRVPMADDLTAEADSAGHTDNRPAIALLPTMLALRDRMAARHGFDRPARVGLGGGISTPASVAAAFAMGAAYVVTGSINQSCLEAGTSKTVREMLCQAGQADVMMAPAADMFEMGVQLQVLKRGTMFGMRARRLHELYKSYPDWTAVPAEERGKVEKTMFRATFDQIWTQTKAFFSERDPTQVAKAETEPRHKMALVFRWYLGLSSHWANAGEPTRTVDYQIWCGPAMGAFNEWVAGTFLEKPEERKVVTVALNLLHGAAVLARLQALRTLGIRVGPVPIVPRPLAELEALL